MMLKYNIVWLDNNASDNISSFRVKLGDAIIFTKADECIQYIESHPAESIYLIVSGSLAKQVVPKIYESSNIIQIFIFCGSISAYAAWGIDYTDKMMIFEHGDDLLERLWNELARELREQGNLYLNRAEEYKQRALKYKTQCG